jgi:NAD(P)-dependent dehydrogenase (short-subunit alcohol dehydrogenase family)
MSLQGKTLFISGASRGIGLAIALRAARDGANIVSRQRRRRRTAIWRERSSVRQTRSPPPAGRHCR